MEQKSDSNDKGYITNSQNNGTNETHPQTFIHSSQDNMHMREQSLAWSTVFGILAVVSAIVSTILVCIWCTGDYSSNGFIPSPNWSTQPLAWHVILLVAGFFFSMIVGVASLSFNSSCKNDKNIGKLIHLSLMVAAIITMSIGLAAVLEYRDGSQQLTTIHSWIGVLNIAAFGSTFVWGFVMALLTLCVPDSPVRSFVSWLQFHKLLAYLTLFLTVLSIETGIMDVLYSGACLAPTGGNSNPVTNYNGIPQGCKIGNGLGITVIVSGIFIFLTIYYKSVPTGK